MDYNLLSLLLVYVLFPALSIALIVLARRGSNSNILYAVLFTAAMLMLAAFAIAGLINFDDPSTFEIWPIVLGAILMVVSLVLLVMGKFRSRAAKGAVIIGVILLIAPLFADFVLGPSTEQYAGPHFGVTLELGMITALATLVLAPWLLYAAWFSQKNFSRYVVAVCSQIVALAWFAASFGDGTPWTEYELHAYWSNWPAQIGWVAVVMSIALVFIGRSDKQIPAAGLKQMLKYASGESDGACPRASTCADRTGRCRGQLQSDEMSAPLVDLLLILIHPITLALAALVVALRSRRNFIAYLVVVSLAVAHLFYYFSEIGSWYTYGFWDVWEEYWNDSFLIVWNWETRAAWLAVGLSIVIVVLNLGAELSRGALSVGPAISSLDQLTSGSQSAAQQRRARFARKIRFTLLSLIA